MKLSLASIALLASAIGSALAQNFFITSPVQTTSWKAGDTVKIQWNAVEKPAFPASKIQIELVDGDSNNANLVTVITADLSGDAKSYEWKVPDSVASKTDYFLRMAAIGSDGKKSYNFSSRFGITGGKGNTATASSEKNKPSSTANKKPTETGTKKDDVDYDNSASGVAPSILAAFFAVPWFM